MPAADLLLIHPLPDLVQIVLDIVPTGAVQMLVTSGAEAHGQPPSVAGLSHRTAKDMMDFRDPVPAAQIAYVFVIVLYD